VCGIFGSYPAPNPSVLESCARRLSHRGPDGFSSYYDAAQSLFLAHCRLAIIDISDRGRQPLCNEDGTIWVTFNGEIYNFAELREELVHLGHQFKSATDTEVIVHGYEQWGPDCVERFRGMFAFCVWDAGTKTLFMCRDRLGIKPLFYCEHSGHFAFASEIKALIALPWMEHKVNIGSLRRFLQHGYVQGPESIWLGISHLPPAHCLTIDLASGRKTLSRYWDLNLQTERWNESSARERLHELLRSSIREHMISDVPLGVFLSGGLDSSALTVYAAGVSPQLNTFSIGFDGWENDEQEAARNVATYCHTTHHQAVVTKGRLAELRAIYAALDEPLADSSVIPTHLLCSMARKQVTVALSGDGGDEILGGYAWYFGIRKTVRKRLSWMLQSLKRQISYGAPWPYGCANELEQFGLLTCPSFSNAELEGLFPDLAGESANLVEGEAVDLFGEFYRSDIEPSKRWQYVDLNAFLVSDNLVRVDRCSMSHGLEVRVPFLDHRIVEFAFSLPEHLRLNGSDGKYILRRLLDGQVPQEVVNKRKQGFSFPIEKYWPIEEMVEEIQNGTMQKQGFICREALKRLLSDRRHGNWAIKVWLLAVLERWCSHWLLGDVAANPWHPASDYPVEEVSVA
jgi:asparagine synthase (glutamine-hydrolysing)